MWRGASGRDGRSMYPGYDLDPTHLTAYQREQIARDWRRARVVAVSPQRTPARRRTLLRLTTGRLLG